MSYRKSRSRDRSSDNRDKGCADCEEGVVINGTAESEILAGSRGNDSIAGNDGNDLIFGFGCDDLLLGNGGSDLIFGGRGDDTIFGGRDDDVLIGGKGDDILSGDQGSDLLIGGKGNDTFVFNANTFATGDVDLVLDFQGGNGSTFQDTVQFKNAEQSLVEVIQDGVNVEITYDGEVVAVFTSATAADVEAALVF